MSDPAARLSVRDATACVLELERSLGPSQVEHDPARCAAYARDDSPVEGLTPHAVIHARTSDDVRRALAVCSAHEMPVFPRAAGTGRTGGATVTTPGVVLDVTPLRGVKEIDRANQLAVVEPGVITGELAALVEREGLFYPPDPASLAQCTLGGNAAENAGGPRAFKYGVTREYVLGCEAVLMDGTALRCGKQTVKGVTGYDVTGLLVGSEGTLAVFTELWLRLIPNPPELRLLIAYFDTPIAAGRAVSAVVAQGLVPRCLELLDRPCCEAVAREGVELPKGTAALLLIELDGEGSSLDAAVQRVGDALSSVGAGLIATRVARDAGEREALWSVRRAMSYALRRQSKHKLSEDIVVPRSRLGEMLAFCERTAEAERIVMPAYGHAGDGNLHVNFLWDEPPQRPGVDRAVEAVFRETVRMGGTLTGEHGLGVTKQDYLALEQSEALIALQRRLKQSFDPRGLLNPNKMFPKQGHRAC